MKGRLAAVILAGGEARRLGGRDKPALLIDGVPLLSRVLGAVHGVAQRIVVGPPRAGLPADVRVVHEDPPGGGPVAATAAGLALVQTELVALLAADLPHLTGAAVLALVAAVDRTAADAAAVNAAAVDGALFVDDTGRRQLLCGVWRVEALRRGLAGFGPSTGSPGAGLSMRLLVGGLRVAEIAWTVAGSPPYFDCDTEDDLRRAEQR